MSLIPTILQQIHKGESQLLGITMLDTEGSALAFTSLQTGTKVEVYQNRALLAALLLAGDELREGDSSNELEIELKKEVTNLFKTGYSVFLRVTLVASNSDYSASSNQQTDINTYKIGNVL